MRKISSECNKYDDTYSKNPHFYSQLVKGGKYKSSKRNTQKKPSHANNRRIKKYKKRRKTQKNNNKNKKSNSNSNFEGGAAMVNATQYTLGTLCPWNKTIAHADAKHDLGDIETVFRQESISNLTPECSIDMETDLNENKILERMEVSNTYYSAINLLDLLNGFKQSDSVSHPATIRSMYDYNISKCTNESVHIKPFFEYAGNDMIFIVDFWGNAFKNFNKYLKGAQPPLENIPRIDVVNTREVMCDPASKVNVDNSIFKESNSIFTFYEENNTKPGMIQNLIFTPYDNGLRWRITSQNMFFSNTSFSMSQIKTTGLFGKRKESMTIFPPNELGKEANKIY